MLPNLQETADLVPFTEEILNGKLHFLCSVFTVKIFFIFLLLINLLISSGICSAPRLSRFVVLLAFIYRAIQCVLVDFYSSRFTMQAPSFRVFGRLSRE